MARIHPHSDPRIMVGKPVIKGTRITVELILENIAFGRTIEELIDSYPHLKREQILAALRYALEVFKVDEANLVRVGR
ncbi:MAG: DUF433 domain-containing protein [Dehalococcoidia bacterium]